MKDSVSEYISCKYAYTDNKGNIYCDNDVSIMCGLCRIAQGMYNKSLNKNKYEFDDCLKKQGFKIEYHKLVKDESTSNS